MRLLVPLLLCALLQASEPPRMPPPFSMERLGAAPLSPTAYRGKVVALAFIYTTCSHCQDLTKLLNKLAPEYAPRGVQFLECAFNPEAKSGLREFLDRFHPPFPVGWANDAAVHLYLEISILDARPLYVPHMVFLDRQGTIRGDYRGESGFFATPEVNIRAELDKLLVRAPRSAAPTTKKQASAPPSHP